MLYVRCVYFSKLQKDSHNTSYYDTSSIVIVSLFNTLLPLSASEHNTLE